MELELVLYSISIYVLLGVYGASGIYMLLKYFISTKSEVKSTEKRLFLLYGFFFIFLMVGRIFLFIFDFYLTEFDISNISDFEFLIWKIGISFQVFSYSFLFALMEKRIMKGKDFYILLILYFIFYIIGMISSNLEDAGIYAFIATAFSIFIPLAYLYIAVKSQQHVRRKAILIFFGFMLIFFATSLDVEPILIMLNDLFGWSRIEVYTYISIIKTVAVVFFFLGFK